jgi:putative ABC transport system permease protein
VLSPRWRKLAGDVRAMRWRLVLIVLALALSLTAVGTVLGARAVLRREIRSSYMSTHPAEATLELPGGVDAELLAEIRARPEIAEADSRDALVARVRVDDDAPWHALQIFVADDFETLRLNRFRPDGGAWPPPTGAMLVERTAAYMMHGAAAITVKTSHGSPQLVPVAGTVHDGGLAPAWQEHRGHAYVTRATLGALGETPVLHQLLVAFRPEPETAAEAEAAATALAAGLVETGHEIGDIRVPPLRKHPHESQMATAQMVLLVFSVLLLALSAILVATVLSAMLARQVREVGAMKTVGARAGQLAGLYAAFVVGLGVLALAPALPLGHLGAQAFIRAMGEMMNLELADRSIPIWVLGVVAAAGLVVPLAAAAAPILGACRLTVRSALARHGARADFVRPSLVRLPMAARNALRRPVRFALTVGLLAMSGALALVALNVERGYRRTTELLPEWVHSDLDVILADPAPASLAAQIARMPGVRAVEAWGQSPAVLDSGPNETAKFFVVHTYPDQGHGSFSVLAPPDGTSMVSYPLVAGRWLRPDDGDAIVLDRYHARELGLGVGDRVGVSLPGARARLTVVGIVDVIPAMSAFVSPATLERLTRNEGRVRLFRVAATGRSEKELMALASSIAHGLGASGVTVAGVMPLVLLRAAIDAHFVILTRALIVLAGIIIAVGLAGLGAAIGVSVAERTREIGAMKAVGATGSRIFQLFVGEAVLVGVASWVVAAALALPLTALVEAILARMGFILPAFVVSPSGIAGWLGVAVAGSAVAALLPARRAARLTVKEAFGEV